ncbi:MAG: ribokinase [Bacillota bacterium]
MRILNFGSLNLDYTYRVPHFVQPGETLSSSDLKTNCGGKGLNQSIALARAGAAVFHAGCVGETDGAPLTDALEQEGVDTRHIRRIDGTQSGHAVIQVDQNGQNCILLYGGANRRVGRAMADDVLAYFGTEDLLLLQNEISEIPYILKKAAERGMRVALNPSPMEDAILSWPLGLVALFVVNEVEAQALSGEAEPLRQLAALRLRYPKAELLLTLGSRGAMFLLPGMEAPIFEPAKKVTAVDTTAAGDTFLGFFLAAEAKGYPAEKCIRIASNAAAFAVGRPGASASIPRWEDIAD